MYLGIQKGAIAALNLPIEWFKSINNIYAKRREIVWKICDVLQCSYVKNSSGLFVWAKIPKGRSSNEFTDKLLYDKNVFVAPGTVFGENGEGYIRFSICVVEEKIQEVLTRVS